MPAQLAWLLLEGVLPLMGAGAIYLILGGCRYITAMDRAQFTYKWSEAADPLGWLYGAIVISFQSAMKCFVTSSDHEILAWVCVVGGVFCFVLLIAAMIDRSAVSNWKPSTLFRVCALGLVGFILFDGYLAHAPSSAVPP